MTADPQAKELAELKAQVVSLQEQCATAQRELEGFMYAVSHDLRAPLRSLSGFSQALLELPTEGGDPKATHYLERIQQASRKLSEMMEALLALSRIARAELQPRTVDFSQLCREAESALRRQFPDHPLRLAIAEGMTAFGDSRQLRALAEALLGNAFKFTQGRSSPEASVAPDPTHANTFRFSDNGVGFDEAYADKLFRPFQRLHSDPQFGGLGMGLATAQRIAARHNGSVRAEGRPGNGADFFVTLGAQGGSAPKA